MSNNPQFAQTYTEHSCRASISRHRAIIVTSQLSERQAMMIGIHDHSELNVENSRGLYGTHANYSNACLLKNIIICTSTKFTACHSPLPPRTTVICRHGQHWTVQCQLLIHSIASTSFKHPLPLKPTGYMAT